MNTVTETAKKIGVYTAAAYASGINDPKAVAMYVGARAVREVIQNVFLSKHPVIGQALNVIA